MNSKNQDTMPALNNADALSLLAYLLTSAEGCLKEPPIYGVHRLATAAVRLAEAWEPVATSETAAFLRDLIDRWEREVSLLSQDPVNLKSYLSQSGISLAEEIKRQTNSGEGLNES